MGMKTWYQKSLPRVLGRTRVRPHCRLSPAVIPGKPGHAEGLVDHRPEIFIFNMGDAKDMDRT